MARIPKEMLVAATAEVFRENDECNAVAKARGTVPGRLSKKEAVAEARRRCLLSLREPFPLALSSLHTGQGPTGAKRDHEAHSSRNFELVEPRVSRNRVLYLQNNILSLVNHACLEIFLILPTYND